MMISEYLMYRLIWLGCFVAYMFWLGYTAQYVYRKCSTFVKVGHAISVVLDLFGCLAGLLML